MNSFCLRIHHYIQPCICLGEGRVQQSNTLLAPYIEKVCCIIVFGKFSRGTYLIVVFNSNIVVFPDKRNLFLISSAIFSIVLSNSSIFLCGVTVFRIPLSRFFHRRKTWTRDHVTLPNSKWRLYLHRLFIPVERRFIAASYDLQMHIRIFLEQPRLFIIPFHQFLRDSFPAMLAFWPVYRIQLWTCLSDHSS